MWARDYLKKKEYDYFLSHSSHITQSTNSIRTELLALQFTLTLCDVKSYVSNSLQKGIFIAVQTNLSQEIVCCGESLATLLNKTGNTRIT